ncbi:FGGY-family carbohydrate kinase [Adhaeretor mobilis]|uniref:L-fuculokinase n=1 Tax=Adhaeretor mobilis TaxID=1930276 RepID=A0A517MZT8_9BACT|nr:FGGY-family carbohydrate kinase [Adhaeretor mobilis]QDT00364.1 L-fuculokinase [Adhaeretor mobilis]
MSNILVFDLGTSYFKICLFDEYGQIVGLQRVPTPVQQTAEMRAELPTTSFIQCLTDATKRLSLEVGGLSDVAAVSFATQANSFVLLDKFDDALTSIILWNDQRALGLSSPLDELQATSEFKETTGLPGLTHEFLPAKTSWFQQHQPQVMEKTARVALISDYLTLWLTGNHVTEAGTAGLSGLVDIHRLHWWTEACDRIKLPVDWLPTIVRAGTDAGSLRQAVAAELGLPLGCKLIIGCLDQYAGAIGAGNTEPGSISETTGTVLATVRCSNQFEKNAPPSVFQGPTFSQDQYYQMVFGEVSAQLLEKYRNSLPDLPSFAELDKLADSVPAGAGGVHLHPDAASKSASEMFLDRQSHHTRGHDVRAIYEAVASELQQQIELLCKDEKPTVIYSVGGAARSDLWLRIKSETLGCPVRVMDCSEPTSLGAAILAQSGLAGVSPQELEQQWRPRQQTPRQL